MVRVVAGPGAELGMTDEELEHESAAIERSLEVLRDLVPLPAWQRVEGVLRRVVNLYGIGLGRALDHARAAGARVDELAERVATDELLGSLLLLHGLHPLSTEERVRRALEPVRRELGAAEDALTLVSVEGDVVHLSADGALGGGAMSHTLVESIVKRVIESAAPEVSSIVIDGLSRPHPGLVQLRTARSSP
jgi:hypothetical protein